MKKLLIMIILLTLPITVMAAESGGYKGKVIASKQFYSNVTSAFTLTEVCFNGYVYTIAQTNKSPLALVQKKSKDGRYVETCKGG